MEIKFSEYKTNEEFSSAVDQLTYHGGATDIYQALRTSLDEMFTSENGMRSHTSKMMVLITDGESDDSQFEDIAKEFQDKNIQLVIVGVGNVNEGSLEKLVANKEDLYIATNFDELLEDVTTTFGSVICTGKLSGIMYSVQFRINFKVFLSNMFQILLFC